MGADVLQGLGGNDIYIVRSKNTTVNEKAGHGTNDRVATSVDFTLAADDHIERLTTTSNGGTLDINLTGNAFAQFITGNAGNNRIEGKGGSDTLLVLPAMTPSSSIGTGCGQCRHHCRFQQRQ